MASTTIDKPHSVDELSALFDEIEVGPNLDAEKSPDYGVSTNENLRPFADRVADVKAVMEPEPEIETEMELSGPALKPVAIGDTAPEDKNEPESVIEPELEPKPSPEPVTPKEEPQMVSSDFSDDSNPLKFTGENLRAYTLIKQKYPQFQLYNGDPQFKEFYQYKVQSLKYLLTRHGVLSLADMKAEIENIKLDKRLGSNLADPVSIGQRMDDSIAHRGRVAALLAKAQSQLPAWKKTFEWLNSKVQKDFELKGAHKRDGLALEHNADMKDYYSELQGFVDSATTIDSFLKSQHDSYSRQLSCVDMREKVGIAHETVASEIEEAAQPDPAPAPESVDSELDGLDTLEPGTVIAKVPIGGLVERDFPGAEIESEFLDGIG